MNQNNLSGSVERHTIPLIEAPRSGDKEQTTCDGSGLKTSNSGTTSPPAHATYPPSMLHNIELCPGFRNRKRDETNEGDAAAKGTRIHKALEKDSIDDLKDEDEKSCAQILKDYIDSVIQEKLPVLPSIDRREVRLKMDLGGGLTTFGTVDRLMIYEL